MIITDFTNEFYPCPKPDKREKADKKRTDKEEVKQTYEIRKT